MQSYRYAVAGLGAVALACATMVLVEAGQQSPNVPVVQAPRMPMAPPAVQGASVTPATEGWVKNADGTTTILLGYMNRNQTQTFDIPVGPNNKIEPAGAVAGANGMDYGQPTHFEVGRAWGVFAVTVPKDFGTKRLTYTITANGQPQSITIGVAPGYQVEPYFRNDNGNTPPVAKTELNGPEFKGPPHGIATSLTATVGQPLPLVIYVSDKGNTVDQQNQFGPPISSPPAGAGAGAGAPAGGGAGAAAGAAGRGGAGGRGGRGGAGAPGAPDDQAGAAAARGGPGGGPGGGGGGGGRGRGGAAPARVTWFVHKSPGSIQGVKFENKTPPIVADPEVAKAFSKLGDFAGKSSTTVTFTDPGEYDLRAQVNDNSGDGGGADQCCWTNVHYKVTVKAAAK